MLNIVILGMEDCYNILGISLLSPYYSISYYYDMTIIVAIPKIERSYWVCTYNSIPLRTIFSLHS